MPKKLSEADKAMRRLHRMLDKLSKKDFRLAADIIEEQHRKEIEAEQKRTKKKKG
jgi:hypothetical protein